MPGTRFVVHPGPLPPGVAYACAYASDGLEPGVHRGLPSPWVTFLVSADGPVRVDGTVGDHDGPVLASRASAHDVLVAGLHDVAARVEQPRRQAGVQLALHPLAVPALLGCRAADLSAVSEHGADVVGRLAVELHDRVGAAASLDHAVREVVRVLARRAREAQVRPDLARAWRLLARPGARVDDVARDVLLSPRQLRTLVARETGCSPKRLVRLARFGAVVGDLAGGDGLAEVAARRGYADQAHLTREFARMAGCPPTRWLAEERRNVQDGGHRRGGESPA